MSLDKYMQDLVLNNVNNYDFYVCYSITEKDEAENEFINYYCNFNNDLTLVNRVVTSNNGLHCNLQNRSCDNLDLNLTIQNNELLYTNIDGYYPNFLSSRDYVNNNNLAYNLNLNHFYIIALLLALPIVISHLKTYFSKGGNI